MAVTTFRADLRAGLADLIDDFITANPTLLVRRFSVRPETLAKETPFAYIDIGPETVGHTQGVRGRVASPSVVLVDHIAENGEVSDRFDILVDKFLEACTQRPHIVSNTVWSRVLLTEEFDEGMYLVRFLFPEVNYADGRSP